MHVTDHSLMSNIVETRYSRKTSFLFKFLWKLPVLIVDVFSFSHWVNLLRAEEKQLQQYRLIDSLQFYSYLFFSLNTMLKLLNSTSYESCLNQLHRLLHTGMLESITCDWSSWSEQNRVINTIGQLVVTLVQLSWLFTIGITSTDTCSFCILLIEPYTCISWF